MSSVKWFLFNAKICHWFTKPVWKIKSRPSLSWEESQVSICRKQQRGESDENRICEYLWHPGEILRMIQNISWTGIRSDPESGMWNLSDTEQSAKSMNIQVRKKTEIWREILSNCLVTILTKNFPLIWRLFWQIIPVSIFTYFWNLHPLFSDIWSIFGHLKWQVWYLWFA